MGDVIIWSLLNLGDAVFWLGSFLGVAQLLWLAGLYPGFGHLLIPDSVEVTPGPQSHDHVYPLDLNLFGGSLNLIFGRAEYKHSKLGRMGWKCVLGGGTAQAGRTTGTWGWGWLVYQEQQVAESGLMGWRKEEGGDLRN